MSSSSSRSPSGPSPSGSRSSVSASSESPSESSNKAPDSPLGEPISDVNNAENVQTSALLFRQCHSINAKSPSLIAHRQLSGSSASASYSLSSASGSIWEGENAEKESEGTDSDSSDSREFQPEPSGGSASASSQSRSSMPDSTSTHGEEDGNDDDSGDAPNSEPSTVNSDHVGDGVNEGSSSVPGSEKSSSEGSSSSAQSSHSSSGEKPLDEADAAPAIEQKPPPSPKTIATPTPAPKKKKKKGFFSKFTGIFRKKNKTPAPTPLSPPAIIDSPRNKSEPNSSPPSESDSPAAPSQSSSPSSPVVEGREESKVSGEKGSGSSSSGSLSQNSIPGSAMPKESSGSKLVGDSAEGEKTPASFSSSSSSSSSEDASSPPSTTPLQEREGGDELADEGVEGEQVAVNLAESESDPSISVPPVEEPAQSPPPSADVEEKSTDAGAISSSSSGEDSNSNSSNESDSGSGSESESGTGSGTGPLETSNQAEPSSVLQAEGGESGVTTDSTAHKSESELTESENTSSSASSAGSLSASGDGSGDDNGEGDEGEEGDCSSSSQEDDGEDSGDDVPKEKDDPNSLPSSPSLAVVKPSAKATDDDEKSDSDSESLVPFKKLSFFNKIRRFVRGKKWEKKHKKKKRAKGKGASKMIASEPSAESIPETSLQQSPPESPSASPSPNAPPSPSVSSQLSKDSSRKGSASVSSSPSRSQGSKNESVSSNPADDPDPAVPAIVSGTGSKSSSASASGSAGSKTRSVSNSGSKPGSKSGSSSGSGSSPGSGSGSGSSSEEKSEQHEPTVATPVLPEPTEDASASEGDSQSSASTNSSSSSHNSSLSSEHGDSSDVTETENNVTNGLEVEMNGVVEESSDDEPSIIVPATIDDEPSIVETNSSNETTRPQPLQRDFSFAFTLPDLDNNDSPKKRSGAFMRVSSHARSTPTAQRTKSRTDASNVQKDVSRSFSIVNGPRSTRIVPPKNARQSGDFSMASIINRSPSSSSPDSPGGSDEDGELRSKTLVRVTSAAVRAEKDRELESSKENILGIITPQKITPQQKRRGTNTRENHVNFRAISGGATSHSEKGNSIKVDTLKWIPKSEPAPPNELVAPSDNWVVEDSKKKLNWFDLFNPRHLNIVETNALNDFEQHFDGKSHANYICSHPNQGAFLLSIKSEREPVIVKENTQKKAGISSTMARIAKEPPQIAFRCLIRDREGDTRVWVDVKSYPKSNKALKNAIASANPSLAWIKQAKIKKIKAPLHQHRLVLLEQKFAQNAIKVGVIYARAGQKKESSMLANTKGSTEFNDFLGFMGDFVRLKGWRKYAGGLDTENNLTGTHSIYTTFEDIEVMFHVSTLLPSPPDDPQCISKKLHIGNDVIVIIWLDDLNAKFKPESLVSKFNHVYIIIQPAESTDPSRSFVRVCTKYGVETADPKFPPGTIFERNGMFRKLLLAKIINSEKLAYQSEGFSAMTENIRYQNLYNLYQEYYLNKPTLQNPITRAQGSSMFTRSLSKKFTHTG